MAEGLGNKGKCTVGETQKRGRRGRERIENKGMKGYEARRGEKDKEVMVEGKGRRKESVEGGSEH